MFFQLIIVIGLEIDEDLLRFNFMNVFSISILRLNILIYFLGLNLIFVLLII
jgi:hypothetical protein